MNNDMNRYTDEELAVAFDRLFPHGFAGPDVLQELAPGGWGNSGLVAAFHPSVEQRFQEAVCLHRNLGSLRQSGDSRPMPPEPTLEKIASEHSDQPIETEREVRELVGQSLWDVFSDNHEVIDAEERVLDLGSFRGSGGFLAERQNEQIGTATYDYMSFYMGTIWVRDRADLTPVYRMIFRRLRRAGLDWVYHFPRLYAVDLRPLREAMETKDEPEWVNYSPSDAFAKEEDQKERDKSLAELRESLDRGYVGAVEQARAGPPPTTVTAYESEYGRLPRGWPPEL
jgi:hypothetical protein